MPWVSVLIFSWKLKKWGFPHHPRCVNPYWTKSTPSVIRRKGERNKSKEHIEVILFFTVVPVLFRFPLIQRLDGTIIGFCSKMRRWKTANRQQKIAKDQKTMERWQKKHNELIPSTLWFHHRVFNTSLFRCFIYMKVGCPLTWLNFLQWFVIYFSESYWQYTRCSRLFRVRYIGRYNTEYCTQV